MTIRHALKEWAAVCSAIGAGDQILLIRKGGIDEKSFDPPAQRFVLLPTQFHQGENQFRPDMAHHASAAMMDGPNPALSLKWWCDTSRIYRVAELERLLDLAPWVIFTEETIRDRFRFRPRQAMHVMVVHAWALPEPVELRLSGDIAGCRSWVELPAQLETEGSRPVLDAAQFEDRLAAVDRLLPREG